MIPRVTLRFTLGYEPLAPLGRSTFQVVLTVIGCGKLVTISLSEAVIGRVRDTTPVAALPLCGANHKSASTRLRRGH